MSIGDNGALRLSESLGLQQGLAYLVRYDKVATLTFSSLAGTIAPAPPDDDCLTGVMQPYEVSAGADGIFLFSSASNSFVRAAAGSRLAPFRCYLRVGTARSPRLKLW